MTRKIIYMVAIALGVVALIALLWWWFLGRSQTPAGTTGTLPSAQNTTPVGTTATGAAQNNIPSTIPAAGAGQTNIPTTVPGGTNTGTAGNVNPATAGQVGAAGNVTPAGQVGVPGVVFVGGSLGSVASSPVISGNGSGNVGSASGGTATGGGTGGGIVGGGVVVPPVNTIGSTGIASTPTVSGLNTTDTTVGTIPDIGGGANGTGQSGSGLGGALVGAAVVGGIACSIPAIAAAIGGSFALAVTGQALATGGQAGVGVPVADKGEEAATLGNTVTTAGGTIAQNTILGIQLSNFIKSNLLDCFARTIAHALLEQIAKSTVAWINSGFNGSPSFVQNYDQFFSNVADNAAGDFIKGSSLSFLCSPFQLQVKIAVAQSYANASASQQCTLTSVTSNMTNFMNGNFSAGGWPALLSFTTVPTNNPYGAYAFGSIGLKSAVANAVNKNSFDLSLSGGFLSIKQDQNCKTFSSDQSATLKVGQQQSVSSIPNGRRDSDVQYRVCDEKIVTPGTAISQALDQTLGINTQSLETAKYFDEIITALVSQLIQNVATVGLSNLSSGGNGYVANTTPVTTTNISQSIFQNIASLAQSGQQLKAIDTQNIASIQSSIAKAQAVKNCLATATSSAPDFATQRQQLATNTDNAIANLNARIIPYTNEIAILDANTIALQNFQTEAQATSDTNQTIALMNSLVTKIQNGTFAQDSNVVNAQERQVTLQSDLQSTDQTTAAGLNQCHAFGQ